MDRLPNSRRPANGSAIMGGGLCVPACEDALDPVFVLARRASAEQITVEGRIERIEHELAAIRAEVS